jgi:hypothetical protein
MAMKTAMPAFPGEMIGVTRISDPRAAHRPLLPAGIGSGEEG